MNLVQGCAVGRRRHGVAQRAVAEHLGEFGKDLQVLLGRVLGYQQREDQPDGLAVGRFEGHRLRQAHERAHRVLQALDAPWGMATPWPSPVEPRRSRATGSRTPPIARCPAGSRTAARPARTAASCSKRQGRAGHGRREGASRRGSWDAREAPQFLLRGADYNASPRLTAPCGRPVCRSLYLRTWRSSLSTSRSMARTGRPARTRSAGPCRARAASPRPSGRFSTWTASPWHR